jgi:hypothetical protein
MSQQTRVLDFLKPTQVEGETPAINVQLKFSSRSANLTFFQLNPVSFRSRVFFVDAML